MNLSVHSPTDGVLTTIVSWTLPAVNGERAGSRRAKEELNPGVGGQVHPTAEQLQWQNHRLRVGDEIRMGISASDRATRLSRREQSALARDRRPRRSSWKVRPRNSAGLGRTARGSTDHSLFPKQNRSYTRMRFLMATADPSDADLKEIMLFAQCRRARDRIEPNDNGG